MEHKYSDLLKKNNIMPTKQRLELADIIFKKHQHFTANELIDRIKNSSLPISQATIYNTLCTFESKGLLKMIDIQNNCKFYDTNLKSHHHVYNISTNKLTDIDVDKVEFSKLPEIPKNVILEHTEVLIKVRNK
jgi:Fur family iron response transcriptional regulator